MQEENSFVQEQEHCYQKKLRELVSPFLKEHGKGGIFQTRDGVRIHYQQFVGKLDSHVVILPGRAENCIKYSEFIYELVTEGHSVSILDHRGQGLSDRLLPNLDVGHVETFEDYISDFHFFMQEKVLPLTSGKPVTLVAHSMGGLIATLYAAKYPDRINGLVLITPMFGIATGSFPWWIAWAVASTHCLVGRQHAYAPFQAPPTFPPFEGNRWTSCPYRYENNTLIQRTTPRLKIGGCSNRWLKTSLEATRKLRKAAKKLRCPVLLFGGGEDRSVRIDCLEKFKRRLPPFACRHIFFPTGRHDLLSENEDIRRELVREVLAFLKR